MPKPGILLLKGSNGTEKTVNTPLLKRFGLKSLAMCVHANIPLHGTIQDSAPMDAKPKIDITLGLIMKNAVVRCVKGVSLLINMFSRKRVVESVPLNLQEPQEVYDLEIEADHCYYANGFLVSNSDAFRYLAVGLKGLERKDSGSADNDLKAVNRYYGL
jgi:hypothetical protein